MKGIGKTMIKTNPIKDNLKAGKPSIGVWMGLSSPAACEAEGSVGWEWLLMDCEHSQIDFGTMIDCFRATQLAGSVPVARVPWNETIWIQRTLDAGAMGLVIPMVNNKEDAEFAVSNTVVSPNGIRSFGGSRLIPYIEGGDYLKWCKENIVVIVQIETVEAVEKIDEIASVPGVDCCYIGPMDLMLSMGEKEQGPGTKHEEAMMRVLGACKNKGVAAGLFCFDAKSVQKRIDQGWQFINCSSDGGHLAAASKADFDSLKL